MNKKNVVFSTAAFGFTSILCMFIITARAVILPTVLSELNGMDYYSITVILSSLTMALVMPLCGKLGDIWSKKYMYCIGAAGYTIALFICGMASHPIVFMTGISLTGLFYGFLYSQQMILIVEIYKPENRPRFIGYFNVITSLACLLGPVAGGVFTDTIGWRWVFFVSVPVSVLNLICGMIGIPKISSVSENRSLDLKGTGLFVACILPFLYALTSGGKAFAWNSPTIIGLFAFSAVMLILLILVERKVENPIIPMKLFGNQAFMVAVFTTLVGGLAFAMQNYLPIYYQSVRGLSVTVSGIISVPRQAMQMVGSFLAGMYLSRQLRSRYKRGFVAIIACLAVTLFAMGFYNAGTMFLVIIICEFLYGIPLGAQGVMTQSLGTVTIDPELMGSGLAFIGVVSTLANSLGAAFTGCLINQYWNIEKIVPEALKAALGAENLKQLGNTSILTDTEKLSAMRMILPDTLSGTFDETIEVLKSSINHGMSVTFFILTVLVTILLLYVVFGKWDKNIRETKEN